MPAQSLSGPSAVELPDAPGRGASGVSSSADPQNTDPKLGSQVTGTVLDVNGNPINGARVQILVQRGFAGAVDATTDVDGHFRVSVPPSVYRSIITSPGLDPFIVSDFTVAPGATYTIPNIAMKITATSADVTVRVTQQEIAEEQIHSEEKQRVLGVLPNFYSSYIWDAAPLTSTQKFKLAGHSVFDPVTIVTRAGAAGVQHGLNIYADYGSDLKGYGARYGAVFGDAGFARILTSAVFPSIFRQDPRYFYKGTGTFKSRLYYAVSRSVITRGNNGKSQLNISRILGSFGAGALSTLYKPDANSGAGTAIATGAAEIAGNSLSNLIREFLLKRVTPSVPEFEQGQPADEAGQSQPVKPTGSRK